MAVLGLLVASFVAHVAVADVARDACSAPEAERVDCHRDESSCAANGCCWKPVSPNPSNVPWCFKASGPLPPPPKPPSPAECKVDDYDKADCKAGAEDGCNAKGCCWKPAGQGSDTPWCFYKAGVVKVPHCTLKGDAKQPFSDAEVAEVRQLFSANLDIQGSGMVVAAPDHATGPGGDYYFAWMRDGALSIDRKSVV